MRCKYYFVLLLGYLLITYFFNIVLNMFACNEEKDVESLSHMTRFFKTCSESHQTAQMFQTNGLKPTQKLETDSNFLSF